jgi:nitrate/nitrite-specific signal transduction histidine kinase
MNKCGLDSRKKRFLGALFAGSILSIGWFLIHFLLTVTHEKDSEIINNVGRLRFYTQQIGVLFLSKPYVTGLLDERDTFEGLQCTVDVLLGEQTATQNCALNIPEMLDDDVKSSLRQWVSHIDRLRDKYFRIVSLSKAEVRETISEVQRATDAIDAIVERASAAAQGRVEVIRWISIIRVITGLLWAVVVAVCFGGVYRPYVTSFKRLQVMERESRSILGAAFDAIVAVNPESPFKIITSSDQFDHLMGQAMVGKSVLSCAQSPAEEQKLLKLLNAAGQSGQSISSWFSRM